MTIFRRQEFRTMKITERHNLSDISIPILIMSGASSNLGNITNINASCSVMFGYTRNELLSKHSSKKVCFWPNLDKKVDILLPKYMRGYHQNWINNFLDYGTSDYLNKDRDSVALHKNKYLMQVNKYVKPISSDGGKNISFVAFFNQKKRFRYEGWLLAKMDEKLIGFSAAIPKIMGIQYDKCVMLKLVTEMVKSSNFYKF